MKEVEIALKSMNDIQYKAWQECTSSQYILDYPRKYQILKLDVRTHLFQ